MYHELALTLGADYTATPSSTLAANAVDQRPSTGAHASAYVVEPEHSCHRDQARRVSSIWYFMVHSNARHYWRGHVLQGVEKMTKDEMQKVQDALVAADRALLSVRELNEALRILDAALAAEPQPAVWMQSNHLTAFISHACGSDSMLARCSHRQLMPDYQPLFLTPPSREWQRLTDGEEYEVVKNSNNPYECIRMTTAALRAKNEVKP